MLVKRLFCVSIAIILTFIHSAYGVPLDVNTNGIVGDGVLPVMGAPLVANDKVQKDKEGGVAPGVKVANADAGDDLGKVDPLDSRAGKSVKNLIGTKSIVFPGKQGQDKTIVVQDKKVYNKYIPAKKEKP